MSSQSCEAVQVESLINTTNIGIESIKRSYPISYPVEDFVRFTDRFREENHLGNTQFAFLYRGKIPCGGGSNHQTKDKNVTVKLWVKEGGVDKCDPQYQKQRLQDEICFLQHPSVNNHPNLVRVIGYFAKGLRYGVIYDLNPVDTLQNLCVKDTFSWLQRIKVAIAIARLVDFLHSCEPPYKVCNLAAAHILIDQDFNPRLVDFGMLNLFDRPSLPERMLIGPYGYIDPQYASAGLDIPGKRDVYAYGVLLLNLISKRVVTQEKPWEPQMDDWATRECRRLGVCSLVHESLKSESTYEATVGFAITFLAMRCVDPVQKRRPTMREIVHFLEKLFVAGRHGDIISVKRMPHDALSVKSFLETL